MNLFRCSLFLIILLIIDLIDGECPPNMIAYWSFDETANLGKDSSVSADVHTATCQSPCDASALSTIGSCKAGSCASFSGESDKFGFEVADHDDFEGTLGGSFTISFWVKVTRSNGCFNHPMGFIGRNYQGSPGDSNSRAEISIGCNTVTNHVVFKLHESKVVDGFGYELENDIALLSDNQWHYVAATFNFLTMRIALVVDPPGPDALSLVTVSPPFTTGFQLSGTKINIGMLMTNSRKNGLDGHMDEVAIFSEALSVSEIGTLALSGTAGVNLCAPPLFPTAVPTPSAITPPPTPSPSFISTSATMPPKAQEKTEPDTAAATTGNAQARSPTSPPSSSPSFPPSPSPEARSAVPSPDSTRNSPTSSSQSFAPTNAASDNANVAPPNTEAAQPFPLQIVLIFNAGMCLLFVLTVFIVLRRLRGGHQLSSYNGNGTPLVPVRGGGGGVHSAHSGNNGNDSRSRSRSHTATGGGGGGGRQRSRPRSVARLSPRSSSDNNSGDMDSTAYSDWTAGTEYRRLPPGSAAAASNSPSSSHNYDSFSPPTGIPRYTDVKRFS